jgi:hypothetical protein
MTAIGNIYADLVRQCGIALRFNEYLILSLPYHEAEARRSFHQKGVVVRASDPLERRSVALGREIRTLGWPPFSIAFQKVRLPWLSHQGCNVA